MNIQRYTTVFYTFLFICLCAFAEATAKVDCSHVALPEALNAMESNDEVLVTTVEVDSWPSTPDPGEGENIYFVFEPKNKVPSTGLIIYPGGNADPRAYAPSAQAIASEGYLVVILQVPSCNAIYGYDRTAKVIADFEEIENWALSGHSLGGPAASQYIKEYGGIDWLIFWASTGHTDHSIADLDIKVLSIYGGLDPRLTPEMIVEYDYLLPADTTYLEIEGGNHSQFAYIEQLEYDVDADITLEEQQDIIVQATVDFISDGDNTGCPAVSLMRGKDQELKTLRRFRDEILAKSMAGQKLIKYYYLNSDKITDVFYRHPTARKYAKKVLELIVPFIYKLLEPPGHDRIIGNVRY